MQRKGDFLREVCPKQKRFLQWWALKNSYKIVLNCGAILSSLSSLWTFNNWKSLNILHHNTTHTLLTHTPHLHTYHTQIHLSCIFYTWRQTSHHITAWLEKNFVSFITYQSTIYCSVYIVCNVVGNLSSMDTLPRRRHNKRVADKSPLSTLVSCNRLAIDNYFPVKTRLNLNTSHFNNNKN